MLSDENLLFQLINNHNNLQFQMHQKTILAIFSEDANWQGEHFGRCKRLLLCLRKLPAHWPRSLSMAESLIYQCAFKINAHRKIASISKLSWSAAIGQKLLITCTGVLFSVLRFSHYIDLQCWVSLPYKGVVSRKTRGYLSANQRLSNLEEIYF